MRQERQAGRKRQIAVFGALGHTGRFVVAALSRRGFTPIAIGRDHAALAASGFESRGIPTRAATIDDPASLDDALAGAGAVINCAGPFLDTAEAVTAAALRARIHYLDVTAEQASAQAVFTACDAAARAAGVIVMPAMGFYGGLSDLLATAAVGDWDRADEIRIGIAMDSWRPTRGTRVTGQRNTAPRQVIADGKLSPLVASEASWDFAEPFGRQDVMALPFSEVPLIARHLRVTELRTYLNHAPLRDLRDATTPPPTAVDDSGRSAQTFLVDVIARLGNQTRHASARGQDIYAVTAPLIVEAVRRILDGEARGAGALAPGAAFDAKNYLRAVAPEPLTVDIASP